MNQKRIKIILTICILLFVTTVVFFFFYIRQAYNMQYNNNKLSRFLCVELDKSEEKEIGKSDGMSVMTYHITDPYLVTVDAQRVNLEEAIRTQKISVKDLCAYPNTVKEISLGEKNATSFVFENYQIITVENTCIIAPLDEIPDEC